MVWSFENADFPWLMRCSPYESCLLHFSLAGDAGLSGETYVFLEYCLFSLSGTWINIADEGAGQSFCLKAAVFRVHDFPFRAQQPYQVFFQASCRGFAVEIVMLHVL